MQLIAIRLDSIIDKLGKKKKKEKSQCGEFLFLPSAQWWSRAKHPQTQSIKNSGLFCFLTTLFDQNPPRRSRLPCLKPDRLSPIYISNQTQHSQVLLAPQNPTFFNMYISLHPTQGTPETSYRRKTFPGRHRLPALLCKRESSAGTLVFRFVLFLGEAKLPRSVSATPAQERGLRAACARSRSAAARRKWSDASAYSALGDTATALVSLGDRHEHGKPDVLDLYPKAEKPFVFEPSYTSQQELKLRLGCAGKTWWRPLKLQRQGKFLMRNVRPAPPLTCLCC